MSDSRYLTSDPFTLWMETITAFFWGPLSLVLVYMISADHPLLHPIQAMVSMGQIYGLCSTTQRLFSSTTTTVSPSVVLKAIISGSTMWL